MVRRVGYGLMGPGDQFTSQGGARKTEGWKMVEKAGRGGGLLSGVLRLGDGLTSHQLCHKSLSLPHRDKTRRE